MLTRLSWTALLFMLIASLPSPAAEPKPTPAPAAPARPAAKADVDPQDPRAQATHQQTALIKIVDDQGATLPLHTFCLDQSGRILAGVGGQTGEVRVFDPAGKFLAKWSVPPLL